MIVSSRKRLLGDLTMELGNRQVGNPEREEASFGRKDQGVGRMVPSLAGRH